MCDNLLSYMMNVILYFYSYKWPNTSNHQILIYIKNGYFEPNILTPLYDT